MSQIKTPDDIDEAVERMVIDGILPTKTLTADAAKKLVSKHLQHPEVAPWFTNDWTLYNECAIIRWDEQQQMAVKQRPDRVMSRHGETVVVDYKFGRQRTEHVEQVRAYMTLLRQMGMENVRGYVWYVYSQQIVEC